MPKSRYCQELTLAARVPGTSRAAGALRRYSSPSVQRTAPSYVFSINCGRSGSKYLQQLLLSCEDTCGEHESAPNMAGPCLHLVEARGLDPTYAARAFKGNALKALRAEAAGATFVDTTNMFIKTFADVAVGELGADNLAVVRLRHDPVQVARSARQLGWFDARWRHLAWPHWHLDPASEHSSCAKYGLVVRGDPVSMIVGHIVACELAGQTFEISYPNVAVVSWNLAELQTTRSVSLLLDQLVFHATYTTMIGRRINARMRQKRARNIVVEPDIAARVMDLLEAYHRAWRAGRPIDPRLSPLNQHATNYAGGGKYFGWAAWNVSSRAAHTQASCRVGRRRSGPACDCVPCTTRRRDPSRPCRRRSDR